ncbi:cupin domain-containing protein [Anaerobacillus sp. CMMVII]|uniref:cupin domain-containing protein n=1 Tax=Anaerobacillus sp. CMMVII TaxID=2755588 RepID=UPI0021B8169F|nr:cupin domain-containing protein [Anaerobacillus sp. CMMVII]MCT8139600.1 cupin domain-containing protein [Anaerobacillus sp. CMMVII]
MSSIGKWENAEPGVTRKIFEPGKSLMMMEVHFEIGAEGYEHSHPHEQLTYCIQGKLEFQIEGKSHIITAGETLVIPSNAKHGAKALEKSIIVDIFTPLREDLLK